MNMPVAGSLRLNTTTGQTEIYTGNQWSIVSAHVTPIGPSDEELCAKHPGLAELKRLLDEAQEKFDAYKALVMEQRC